MSLARSERKCFARLIQKPQTPFLQALYSQVRSALLTVSPEKGVGCWIGTLVASWSSSLSTLPVETAVSASLVAFNSTREILIASFCRLTTSFSLAITSACLASEAEVPILL